MLTPIYEEYPDYHCLSHLNPQSSDLSLFSCGIQKCPPGHTWDKPRPQYHLHFIIDGKGTFQANGKTWRLSRRQLFLCPPDTPVYYSADSEDPWHYAWVSVYGPKASLWLKQTGFDQDTLVRDSYIPVEQFTILIQQLLNTWKPAPGSELRQLSFLFHLMSLLISSNTAKKHFLPRLKQTQMKHFLIRHSNLSQTIMTVISMCRIFPIILELAVPACVPYSSHT